MAIKKSQLYASLWQMCDELRGGMDASQYKDYILTLLFMKYVSDKAASDPDSLIFVPEGGGFADMVNLKGDKEIGDKINKIIGRLAEENDLKGIIDQADFNDGSKLGRGKEMQDRLSKLVAIFESLDFRANRVEGDDLLGDAYEYLMRHFATESGKSKGQFYTPAEVSRIMAKVIGIGQDTQQYQTIYDPACGSGSLLLRAADAAPRGLSIYGQEKDNATHALASMNMILHDNADAEIRHGNTLAAPDFTEMMIGSKPSTSLSPIRLSLTKPGPTDSIQQTTFTVVLNMASHPPEMAITPSCYTSSPRSRAEAKAQSFCRTVCCSAATGKQTSAKRSSDAVISKVSSGYPQICFTAPVSPPVSSLLTRRTPHIALASL